MRIGMGMRMVSSESSNFILFFYFIFGWGLMNFWNNSFVSIGREDDYGGDGGGDYGGDGGDW